MNNNIKEKLVKKVNQSWNLVKSQILPPHNAILSKNINYKYLQKDGIKKRPVLNDQIKNSSIAQVQLKASNQTG